MQMDLRAKVGLGEKMKILVVSRLAFEFSFEQIARQSSNLDRGAVHEFVLFFACY
jgi:hypothetical protein